MVDLSEPIETYKVTLKEKFNTEAENYWKELVKEAGTKLPENELTCKEYYDLKKKEAENQKQLDRTKGLKNFFKTVGIIALIVGAILLIYGISESKTGFIVAGAILPVVGIIVIILAVKLPKQKIKMLEEKVAKLREESSEKLKLAYQQMKTLNSLYDWNIPAKIFNRLKTVIEMDQYFDVEKFQFLQDRYGLADQFGETTSTLCVQSGSVLGNPFLIVKTLDQYWYTKRYENSIVIHWTTTEHTKNGTRTVHHSQTLTAYVDKPAAGYNRNTTLIYGNEAAPNLSFSRGPSGIDGMNEKQIEKMIAKETKGFEKKARKALTDNNPNTNYVQFGNNEFESLFGGENRDNEVEFRLLFTPLAQNNLIKLIKSKDGFGDDWYFQKAKKLNYIQSAHSQSFDYYANPEYFVDFDSQKAHERFINYNNTFFKSFYFDLAPLMSIPLYQQMKTKEYIYKRKFQGNVTYYEDEMMANSFGGNAFAHEMSQTENILKTELNKTVGGTDEVVVSAHGFFLQEHVDYFEKWGGDGRMHTIPVTWYEYVPVCKQTNMAIMPKKSSRQLFNEAIQSDEFKTKMAFASAGAYLYQRGIFAAILLNTMTEANAVNMNNALNSNISNSNNKNSNINSNTVSNSINDTINDIKNKVEEATSTVKTNIKNGKLNDGNDNNSNNQ